MRRTAIPALILLLGAALALPAAAASRDGGAIQGTITDAAGNPLPVAANQVLSVEAFDAATGARHAVLSTNPQGGYRLGDLPAGTYKLRFRYLDAAGNLLRYRWHDDQPTYATASAVTLSAGATLTVDAALDLLDGATVRGRFLSAAGGGIDGTQGCYGVDVFEADGISLGVVGRVDIRGVWSSAGLIPAGEMTAVARYDPEAPRCPDVLPYLWKWYRGPSGGTAYATDLVAVPRLLAAADTFTVVGGVVLNNVNFKLTPVPRCLLRAPTIIGTTLPDIICGTEDDDFVFGLAGDDRLFGEEGDDFLCGDAGDDILKGGPGRDTLIGGDGEDRGQGGAGQSDLCLTEVAFGCP